MAKAKGHDKLTPEGIKFFAEIDKLVRQQVRVGFQQGEATTESGVDMATVAAFNELGTATAPARPFMRNSVDNHLDTIGNMGAAQLENIVKGGTAEQALNSLGEMQTGLIKDTISNSSGWAEPNAPSTIAKKGSAVPLVDSGQMAQSVHYVVVPKGSQD